MSDFGIPKTEKNLGINKENLLLNFVEFRGLSYAGGGDAGAITMPNVRITVVELVVCLLIAILAVVEAL